MYRYDNRVVITLDAGGTNLVFGAMQANKFIVDPITLPSNADNLDKCLATMVEGFQAIIDKLEEKPVAISFAFPGPADYPNGIIGGYLPNFPSFREGVALGPFLEYKFGIPVFINNDGDLFAYGEALGGALPEAARKAFAEMGEIAGDAMATAVTLIDGLIVIGGGITGARKWIMPSLLKELRSKMHTIAGDELNRVQMKVYDLDSEEEFKEFAKGDQRTLKVYGTDRYVAYDPQKRIGVAISKLGASNAISVGAYAFALSQLDAQKAQ